MLGGIASMNISARGHNRGLVTNLHLAGLTDLRQNVGSRQNRESFSINVHRKHLAPPADIRHLQKKLEQFCVQRHSGRVPEERHDNINYSTWSIFIPNSHGNRKHTFTCARGMAITLHTKDWKRQRWSQQQHIARYMSQYTVMQKSRMRNNLCVFVFTDFSQSWYRQVGF